MADWAGTGPRVRDTQQKHERLGGAKETVMTKTPQSTRRGLSLWHMFVFVIVAVGVVVIAGALADGLYTYAGIVLVVVAGGLPVAARMRRLRASLSGEDDREHRR